MSESWFEMKKRLAEEREKREKAMDEALAIATNTLIQRHTNPRDSRYLPAKSAKKPNMDQQ